MTQWRAEPSGAGLAAARRIGSVRRAAAPSAWSAASRSGSAGCTCSMRCRRPAVCWHESAPRGRRTDRDRRPAGVVLLAATDAGVGPMAALHRLPRSRDVHVPADPAVWGRNRRTVRGGTGERERQFVERGGGRPAHRHEDHVHRAAAGAYEQVGRSAPFSQAGSMPTTGARSTMRGRGQSGQSTATASAAQISRIRTSPRRPTRLTRIAIDTLSTESRFTAERRGTGSSPGSSTTSLTSPRIVVVHGATRARR